MRPILKPDLPASLLAERRGPLLLAAIGPYCSICERSIPAEFWILDAGSGAILEPESANADWGESLLVCHDCADMHRRRLIQAPTVTTDSLLLPDRDDTFGTGDTAPFQYRLENVLINELDVTGEKRSSQWRQRVVVRGATPEAHATVVHFALNTRYWDGESTVNIPDEDQSTQMDRRMDLRTGAWFVASGLVPLIRGDVPSPSPSVGDAPVALIARSLAQHQGFWSTFATVFWNEFRDMSVVLDLLVPSANRVEKAGSLSTILQESEFQGASSGAFPGTRTG